MKTHTPKPLIALLMVGTAGISSLAADQIDLPLPEAGWIVPSEHEGRLATEPIRVIINGVGTFDVDPAGIQTLRPDIVQTNHVSVFDIIVKLDQDEDIGLEYNYDESMETHVIDSLSGESGWWYQAHYDSGWMERNAHRMDHYPVKNGTRIRFLRPDPVRLEVIFAEFAEEVVGIAENDGVVIAPWVEIEGPRGSGDRILFKDVVVTAHDTRADLFRPGTITALDVLLSMGEQGLLTGLGITWYDSIFRADPVDHYFVEHIQAEDFNHQAFGSCGFVYEIGYSSIGGFDGAHVHIPTDARVLVSPEYALWFWLCL